MTKKNLILFFIAMSFMILGYSDTVKAKPGEPVDRSWIKTQYLNVVYASKSSAQVMDIYIPNEGSGPFPLIISIHGGAFKSGDKADGQESSMVGTAASGGIASGYAVASINYRLSGEAKWPAQINDVKAAIKFLRANAVKYNLNPDKFATWGGSAGGNLAALAAVTGGVSELVDNTLGNTDVSDTIQASVDWFGPIYFSTMDVEFAALGLSPAMGATNSDTSPETAYLGKTIGTTEAEPLVIAASPQTYITSDDPAFFIQHGTADRNIPITQSENFVKKLAEVLGADKVTFEKIEGAGHGTSEFSTTGNITKVIAFLDTTLGKSIIKGDIDNNKTLDIQDAIQGLKVLAIKLECAICLDADVNGDENIGLEDVVYILQVIAELI